MSYIPKNIKMPDRLTVYIHGTYESDKVPVAKHLHYGKTFHNRPNYQSFDFDNRPTAGYKLEMQYAKAQLRTLDGNFISISDHAYHHILRNASISKTFILSELVFYTTESVMIPVVVGSKEHTEILEKLKVSNKKVLKKDIPLGSTVRLKDGTEGVFYGCVNLLYKDNVSYHSDHGISTNFLARKRYVMKVKDRSQRQTYYYHMSNFDISEILFEPDAAMTAEEAANFLQSEFANREAFADYLLSNASIYTSSNVYYGVANKKKKKEDIELTRVAVTSDLLTEMMNDIYFPNQAAQSNYKSKFESLTLYVLDKSKRTLFQCRMAEVRADSSAVIRPISHYYTRCNVLLSDIVKDENYEVFYVTYQG